MPPQNCVRCRMPTDAMVEVPADVGAVLRKVMSPDAFFRKVCPGCLEQLQSWKADPALVTNRMDPGEFKKLLAWAGRSDLIKMGVALFRAKNYEESKAKYEEYIQVVEQVFGVSREQISQKSFQDSHKDDELAIYVLVLWDMFIMEDGKNEAQQEMWARKITELSTGLPLRATLLQQMKAQEKKLKNRVLIKKMITDFGGGGCFVATYAFGDADAVTVRRLRDYRDLRLSIRPWGASFIKFYYRFSPRWVDFFQRLPGQSVLRFGLRLGLYLVVIPLTLGLSRRTLPHQSVQK